MKREKDKKNDPLYFSIKEVCKILNVKPHIIDYWEKRFPEIKPIKIGKRNFYKKEQIELLSHIKKLLDEGYSLEGIRKKLFAEKKEKKKGPSKEILKESVPLFPGLKVPVSKSLKGFSEETSREELLKKILKEVLRELKALYQWLNR
ncbi:MAG: MerR family transcriptional regulator [Caldimicrobium sp.]